MRTMLAQLTDTTISHWFDWSTMEGIEGRLQSVMPHREGVKLVVFNPVTRQWRYVIWRCTAEFQRELFAELLATKAFSRLGNSSALILF